MNYSQALAKLKNRSRKKLKLNTWLLRQTDSIVVRLYNTDIIAFYPDRVVLNSGGWHTPTTSRRINEYSPVKVYGWSSFYDGMTYSADAEGEYKLISEEHANSN